MRTLKVISFLLAYPEQHEEGVYLECLAILRSEKWLPAQAIADIEAFIVWRQAQDLLDLQEIYVDLFDRTPSLSLHLFEHVHGDSRDRGQAMVDMVRLYQEAGLVISVDEMPDYLPLFLEYLSILKSDQIQDQLGGAVNIIAAIAGRLKKRESLYAFLFDALVEAAARRPDPKAIAEALEKASGEAYDFVRLDKEWEEQFAFDNTLQTTEQGGGCPKVQDMVARMKISETEKGEGHERNV